MKPEHHKTLIVEITEIEPIADADKIELVRFGLPYQCVSQKGTFKVGDLAVYIQPDSVVPATEPFRFIWGPYVTSSTLAVEDYGRKAAIKYEVPEKRRRITVKRMRGQWSEGLLLPVKDFPELMHDFDHAYLETHVSDVPQYCFHNVGDDVSDLLGVTHYQPAEDEGSEGAKPVRKKRRPTTFRGWFNYLVSKVSNFFYFSQDPQNYQEQDSPEYPKFDVPALKSLSRPPFYVGEHVTVTEKIHGSNARFVFLDDKMYTGSRNLWVTEESTGYPRKALKAILGIEMWCRQHEGFALYGEVTPTQKGFDYGTKEIVFHVFNIRTPDGKWLSANDPIQLSIYEFGLQHVPILYGGEYDDSIIKKLVDGKTQVSAALSNPHIREGIVIKPTVERESGRRVEVKVVSNAFLEKDSK